MVNKERIGSFIVKKRSIVPNIITMTNMIMGFFAIIYASRADAESLAIAGILIFIGAICDVCDGAVARALRVESPVGVQLDSLADGIAYGIAPAVIAYQGYLSKLGPGPGGIDLGLLIAPIYPICAIYRLARFNTTCEEQEGFTGLPSPAAGILVAAVPVLAFDFFFFTHLPFLGTVVYSLELQYFIPLYVLVGLLMVSRVDYNKLYAILTRKGKVPAIIALVAALLLAFFFRIWALFFLTVLYTSAGIINYIIKLIRGKTC